MGALSGFVTGLYRPADSIAEPVLTLPETLTHPYFAGVPTEKTAGISREQIVSAVKRDLPGQSTLDKILAALRVAAPRPLQLPAEQRVLPRGDEPGTEATGSGLPWLALAGLGLAGAVGYFVWSG